MNKKTTIWVVLLLIVVAAIGAWVYFATKPTEPVTKEEHTHTDSEKHTDEGTDNPEAVVSATITYTDDGFSPATVTIKKGQSVKIVNNSTSAMEFSSADHPTHLEDPELNLESIQPGGSGTVTPKSVGTHGYHDHIHSEHTGTIIVTE